MPRYVSRRTALKTIGLSGLAVGGVSAVAAQSDEDEEEDGQEDENGEGENGDDEEQSSKPEVLYEFDGPDAESGFPGQLPENVAVDLFGNKYVSLPSIGQVWQFSPDNEPPEDPAENPYATFETGGTFLVGPTGVEVDLDGTLFVCFASDLDQSGAADTNGVWRVSPDGARSLYAELPGDGFAGPTFPNDLVPYGDGLLVTDSFRGVVYHATPDGEATVWASGPLLEPAGPGGFGANGIAVGLDRTVYVANLDEGRLVEIPVDSDGAAGTPTTFVVDDALVGADGLAVDVRGDLYAAVNQQNAVRRVTPDGTVETVTANEEDGFSRFDFPADVTFGTSGGEQTALFVPNLAFSDVPDPTLMKLDVGVPGLPIVR